MSDLLVSKARRAVRVQWNPDKRYCTGTLATKGHILTHTEQRISTEQFITTERRVRKIVAERYLALSP